MPDKRELLSNLIDAAAAYIFSREMFPIAGFAERIEERGFELAEAYRSFARADAFTILDNLEENALLKERVKVLEGALEPFAKFARHVRAEHPGWDTDKYQIDPTLQSNCEFPGMGAFRRARSLTTQEAGE